MVLDPVGNINVCTNIMEIQPIVDNRYLKPQISWWCQKKTNQGITNKWASSSGDHEYWHTLSWKSIKYLSVWTKVMDRQTLPQLAPCCSDSGKVRRQQLCIREIKFCRPARRQQGFAEGEMSCACSCLLVFCSVVSCWLGQAVRVAACQEPSVLLSQSIVAGWDWWGAATGFWETGTGRGGRRELKLWRDGRKGFEALQTIK